MDPFENSEKEKKLEEEIHKVVDLIKRKKTEKSTKPFLSKVFLDVLLTFPGSKLTQKLSTDSHTNRTIRKDIVDRKELDLDFAEGWWSQSDIQRLIFKTTKNSFRIDEKAIGKLRDRLKEITIFGEPLLLVEKPDKYYIKLNDDPRVFLVVFLAYLEIINHEYFIRTYYYIRNKNIVEKILRIYLKQGWDEVYFSLTKDTKANESEQMSELLDVLIQTNAHHIWNFYTNRKLFKAFRDVEIQISQPKYESIIKSMPALKKISDENKNKLIKHLALMISINDEGHNVLRKILTKPVLLKHTKSSELHKDSDAAISKKYTQFEIKYEKIIEALALTIDGEIKQFAKSKTLNK